MGIVCSAFLELTAKILNARLILLACGIRTPAFLCFAPQGLRGGDLKIQGLQYVARGIKHLNPPGTHLLTLDVF